MTEDPIERFGALFERDGDRYIPTQLTRGPWDPRAMHGGAPSALFAHVCETYDPGPAGFVARLTVELLRPVPLIPLTLRVRTIRPGRKVQWLEAVLLDADEREMARATRVAIAHRGGRHELDRSASSPMLRRPSTRVETHRRSSASATSASGARTTCASCAELDGARAGNRVAALALPGGRG